MSRCGRRSCILQIHLGRFGNIRRFLWLDEWANLLYSAHAFSDGRFKDFLWQPFATNIAKLGVEGIDSVALRTDFEQLVPAFTAKSGVLRIIGATVGTKVAQHSAASVTKFGFLEIFVIAVRANFIQINTAISAKSETGRIF